MDSSAKLGEKLLQGWTMLEEGCDDCCIPLMRKPRSSEEHCVSCGKINDPSVVEKVVAAPEVQKPQEMAPVVEKVERQRVEIPSDSVGLEVYPMYEFLNRASHRINQLNVEDPLVGDIAKNMVLVTAALKDITTLANP